MGSIGLRRNSAGQARESLVQFISQHAHLKNNLLSISTGIDLSTQALEISNESDAGIELVARIGTSSKELRSTFGSSRLSTRSTKDSNPYVGILQSPLTKDKKNEEKLLTAEPLSLEIILTPLASLLSLVTTGEALAGVRVTL